MLKQESTILAHLPAVPLRFLSRERDVWKLATRHHHSSLLPIKNGDIFLSANEMLKSLKFLGLDHWLIVTITSRVGVFKKNSIKQYHDYSIIDTSLSALGNCS